jgi:hypothetical protein
MQHCSSACSNLEIPLRFTANFHTMIKSGSATANLNVPSELQLTNNVKKEDGDHVM